MKQRVYNFSAGPAVLPESVLETAREAVWSHGDSGIGILEHSHRGPEFTEILERAEASCRELASIPDDYAVLFLQGGASTQFFMVPMNLLPTDGTADYVVTGTWSRKALEEGRRIGRVHVAGSSEDRGFREIPQPDSLRWSAHPAYAHFTSNNTICGTQWPAEPDAPQGAPLVCDASSDIFSRPIDVHRYGLIYAGAQKNLGPAGVTLVIVRRDLLERAPSSLPPMLRYAAHAAAGSRYNTPPVFSIYVMGLVLRWIRDLGGLEAMEERNTRKAQLLYRQIDGSGFFRGTAAVGSRSAMNVCFRAPDEELERRFIAEATARGLAGLKGHRSVGGMRASVYNALPLEGCEALASFMREFERANG